MLALLLTLAVDLPTSLPDRWLLKLAPLPDTPEALFTTAWYYSNNPRYSGATVQEWTTFRRPLPWARGEATVVRSEERSGRTDFRTVPLAVHASLVEFDRRLYTVVVNTQVVGRGETVEWLSLGTAVEAKGNVWYQAGTRPDVGGKTIVEEWRIDFAADPRKAGEGKATIRGRWRDLTSPDAESMEVATAFKRKGYDTTSWQFEFTAADDKKLPRRLPTFVLRNPPDVAVTTEIVVHGGSTRYILHSAPKHAPVPKPPAPVELVQPPKKP